MKKSLVLIGRILALTIIGLIVTIVASAVTPQPEIVRAAQNSGNSSNALLLLLVERLVVALVIAFILENTVVRGWKLAGYMLWAVFGITTFMTQIETIIFGSAFPGLSVPDVLMLVLTAFVGTVLYVHLAILVMGKWNGTNLQTRPLFRKDYLPRVALIAAIYPVIYFFFGYFVAWQSAAVREFYATTTITTAQPLLTIIQIVRGALWVFAALPLLVMFDKRWQTITAVTGSFSLFTSIVLIVPNPLMPAPVAHAHLVELALSMALFGLVTGWIMTSNYFPRKKKSR